MILKKRIGHAAILLVTFSSLGAAQYAIAIDSDIFQVHFKGNETVPLHRCNKFCGTSWSSYPWLDIQARIGTWIVPLFLLIGSFQFAQLRILNTGFVAVHFMADPITSIYNLLTKLATQHDLYYRCMESGLPDTSKKAVAIILAAYEDWESYFVFISTLPEEDLEKKLSKSALETLEGFERKLKDVSYPQLQTYRINECLAAAKELSDCRSNGLGKTLLGTANYVAALTIAFTHMANGNFNNRTGHSMAFGILWTWLLVIVTLSSIIGSFVTKRSAKTILERLERHLHRIDDEQKRLDDISQRHAQYSQASTSQASPTPSPFSPIERMSSFPFPHPSPTALESQYLLSRTPSREEPKLFSFHILKPRSIKKAYRTLEQIGMNYCIRPSLLCPSHLKVPLGVISLLPVLIATSGAAWISVTSPTYGFGCRSLHQLSFLVTWSLSAILSITFRHRYHGRKSLTLTRMKDSILAAGMGVTFGMGFIGWFNSCFCWSSWFSNWRDPYIIVQPDGIIKTLAKTTWPKLCFGAVGLHLAFLMLVVVWFRKGAMLYYMSDEEHETWSGEEPDSDEDDDENENDGARQGGRRMRGRIFSEDFTSLAERGTRGRNSVLLPHREDIEMEDARARRVSGH